MVNFQSLYSLLSIYFFTGGIVPVEGSIGGTVDVAAGVTVGIGAGGVRVAAAALQVTTSGV